MTSRYAALSHEQLATLVPELLLIGQMIDRSGMAWCISNFGRDQANAIKQAVDFGIKQQMKIVVPVILHNQRLAVGPEVFEGVVGGSNYYWGLEKQNKSAADFNAAFGGYKKSGNGREWGEFGFHEYLEVKSLLGYEPPKAAQ